MDRTLLLSAMYEPMATISWRKAITLLTLGKVEVIEEHDRDVRSISLVIKLPSVVRLIQRFRRHKQRVRFSKQNLFARDRWTCQYCGQRETIDRLTQDHVVPRSLGGKTSWENVVTCCPDCNGRKANRTPEQAGMRLGTQPRRPDWVPILVVRIGEGAPPEWRSYCGDRR
jgi:5-methylcytosine-specific restriction endonuclease McrA